MAIKKIVKTQYIDDESGFEFTFEPVEDSITITKTNEGSEARYLVRDEVAMSPDEMSEVPERGVLFLVHYHRSFDVRNDEFITEDDLRDWYQRNVYGNKSIKPIEQETEYWIFPVAAYIHGGVVLSIGDGGHFPDQRWDVSHVGAVLALKTEWKDKSKAYMAAASLIEEWNSYLSGEVYGIVRETYDKDKNQIDQDSCWGFYGYKYAMEALKDQI